MKKVILTLAAVAVVVCMSSCKKTCVCKSYVAGIAGPETEVELDKDNFKKCSEMNTVVTLSGIKTGLECE